MNWANPQAQSKNEEQNVQQTMKKVQKSMKNIQRNMKNEQKSTKNEQKSIKNVQQKTSLRNLHKVGTKSIILPQNTVCIYCTSQLSQILETYLTPLKRSDEDEGHIKFLKP